MYITSLLIIYIKELRDDRYMIKDISSYQKKKSAEFQNVIAREDYLLAPLIWKISPQWFEQNCLEIKFLIPTLVETLFT